MRRLLLLLGVPLCSAAALEQAAYDSTGRLIALLSAAEDLEVTSHLVAVLPSGKRVPIQVRTPRTPIRRERDRLLWHGEFELPDTSRGRWEIRADEQSSGLDYAISIKAEAPLEIDRLEWVLDLPRRVFLEGRAWADPGVQIRLPAVKPPDVVFYRGEASRLRFQDAAGQWELELALDERRGVALVDRFDSAGRSYQVRLLIHKGALAGQEAAVTIKLRLNRVPTNYPPVNLSLDLSQTRYRFDGFGGNYCWNNLSPASAYTLDNLKIAWGRFEMKLREWDKERDNPGAALRADFEAMRRFQKSGVPYVISIWWLPERFYTDPYEKPRSQQFRQIDPERWQELLDLVGSYLLYAKNAWGVEPDLFSFNEPNIGVYVGFDPEAHAKAIKRFGAHFEKLGLKTRMLLGDATGPRNTHTYVLAAAADAEAMRYVGAVGFHSWGGATAEQYAAWGEVGEWLALPLLVAELGLDAAAYHTRSWDSFHYGLRETRLTQEVLLYARPQGTQYWQFTDDYSLVRVRDDGTVEPTPRFWLMKHFTDLVPQKSEALATNSDQPLVLFTAFRAGNSYALNTLNLGGERKGVLAGLPELDWQATETTETRHFETRPAGRADQGRLELTLPARSLVTLTGQASALTAP